VEGLRSWHVLSIKNKYKWPRGDQHQAGESGHKVGLGADQEGRA